MLYIIFMLPSNMAKISSEDVKRVSKKEQRHIKMIIKKKMPEISALSDELPIVIPLTRCLIHSNSQEAP